MKDAADTQLMVLEAFVMSQTENKSVLDTEPASASPFQMQSFSQLYLAVKTPGFSSHGSYQKKHRQYQLKSPFRNHLLWTLIVDTFSHSQGVVPTDLKCHR